MADATSNRHNLSEIVFSDAGRQLDRWQLAYDARLLVSNITAGAPFHLLLWSSLNYRKTVRSIGAAEILHASEDIAEGNVLARTLL